MANQLDEENGPIREDGKDINVIAKQIPVKVGVGSTIFEILLWLCFIIPGVVFLLKKIKAGTYLRQLEQQIQHDASQIDNYLGQRVVILSNLAKLVDKAVSLDKETFTAISAARSGRSTGENALNENSQQADRIEAKLNIAMEAYPDLKSHQEIQDAIQQNSYLQKEITAAREQYNDRVAQWNREIQIWPVNMIVAPKNGYTTRIPFIASKETKDKARDVFF